MSQKNVKPDIDADALSAALSAARTELRAIAKVEGSLLPHARRCGDAINLAAQAAGVGSRTPKEWYAKNFKTYFLRNLQNYRTVAKNWDRVKGCKSIAEALETLRGKKAKGSGEGDGEDGNGDKAKRRSPRPSLDKIDLDLALQALDLRLPQLGEATPAERVGLIGRLVEMQRKISETVQGLMRPAA